MFTGSEIAETLSTLGVTHAVWLPDSEIGQWESALEASPIELIRVCREGEAWPLAAGLMIGGKQPIVIMQTTGLFESGDALRNVLFDMQLPLFAIVGYRSYLVENSADTAKKFAEPILAAWRLDYVLISKPDEKPRLAEHILACRDAARPGVALIAEGRM